MFTINVPSILITNTVNYTVFCCSSLMAVKFQLCLLLLITLMDTAYAGKNPFSSRYSRKIRVADQRIKTSFKQKNCYLSREFIQLFENFKLRS